MYNTFQCAPEISLNDRFHLLRIKYFKDSVPNLPSHSRTKTAKSQFKHKTSFTTQFVEYLFPSYRHVSHTKTKISSNSKKKYTKNFFYRETPNKSAESLKG